MNLATIAALSIVMIGDSHSDYSCANGEFGYLGRKLTEIYPQMELYAVSNSDPTWWVGERRHKMNKGNTFYQDRHCKGGDRRKETPLASGLPNADLLIIEQGTNMVGRFNDEKIKTSIQNLYVSVQGKFSSILWIGPPPARSDVIPFKKLCHLENIVKRSVLQFGSYYSSLTLPTEENSFLTGAANGTHLKMGPAGMWAQDVAKEINRLVGHPGLKEYTAYPALPAGSPQPCATPQPKRQ